MYNDLRSIRRHPALHMRKEYMGELYNDLEMFSSIYSCCDDEVKTLLNSLLEIWTKSPALRAKRKQPQLEQKNGECLKATPFFVTLLLK